MDLREYLDQREKELTREIKALVEQTLQRKKELKEICTARKAIGEPIGAGDERSAPKPHVDMTMRELATRALKEQFPNGATITEMVDYIKGVWGRDIDRNNFSPQLSRMYQEGLLGRVPSTRRWFLVEPERRVQGFKPYFDQRTGRIAWCEPSNVADNPNYEPARIHTAIDRD